MSPAEEMPESWVARKRRAQPQAILSKTTRLARSILESAASFAVSLMRVELSHRSISDPKTQDFAHCDRCPGLDGLEVMSARWVEHSFTPHMHEFYAVSLNYGGRGAFDCRREVHDATPGTAT
jgi:AraC-like ligand binding domain